MQRYRSHTCADLSAADTGQNVRLAGWVHRVRDHGGVLFVDLRDHYGITQLLADSDSPVFAEVEKLRAEWVIRVDGEVLARDPALVNPKLPTGAIEVFIRDIEVLSRAEELPLPVFSSTCGASICTPISCCAARSLPAFAGAWPRPGSPNTRPRS